MEETLMAKDSRYCVQLRRRKEGKTDYKARKALVLSGKPRLVARGTLKNVIAQIIMAKPHGDEVLVSAHSRELKNYEWKAPGGNLPAAYLTGLLCGLKAKAQGVKEVILDIGLHSPSKGARVFAMLKGVLDAGVHVPHSEEKLPDEKRIQGEHIAKYAASLASNPEEYQSKFSKYLEQKLPPEDLPKHFAKVKKEISAAFKSGGKKT
jgi:large subunit ribosomal protein L18